MKHALQIWVELAVLSLMMTFSLGCGDPDAQGSETGDTESQRDSDSRDTASQTEAEADTVETGEGEASDSPSLSDKGDTAVTTDPIDTGVGDGFACRYVNPFSSETECREYFGEWTAEQMAQDCAEVFTGVAGVVTATACSLTNSVGTCTLQVDEARSWVTTFYNLDEHSTGVAETMCLSYWSGVWRVPGDTDTGESTEPLLPEAQAAMISDGEVTVSPECADVACLEQLAVQGQGIEFVAVTGTPQAGVVLVPEQAVDPRAYAPAARLLALQGYFVAVLTSSQNAAHGTSEIASHSELASWFMGGHGEGAVAAARLVREQPALVDGVFLWGAVLGTAGSLSDSVLPVAVIYGLEDGVATPMDVEADAVNRPDDSVVVPLRGANHVQFSYSTQGTSDLAATIDLQTQHDLFVGATSHFMHSAILGPLDEHPGFADAKEADLELCRDAQLIIANAGSHLGAKDVSVTMHESATSLGAARPNIDTGLAASVEVQGFDQLAGNPTLRGGPPVHASELWCKMKSQDALVAGLGIPAKGKQGTCSAVNEAVLEQALGFATGQQRQDFADLGPSVLFGDDVDWATGIEWLVQSRVEVAQIGDLAFSVHSPRIEVPMDSGPVDVRGAFYCKVWSVSRALRFVLEWR